MDRKTDAERIPNLFVPGFPKSGTTSLARHLAEYSGVYVPDEKESYIFNQNPCELKRRLKLYRESATQSSSIYLDATPTYLSDTDSFLSNVERYGSGLDKSKFIILLRDPIDRYISHVKHNRSRGSEHRALPIIVEDEAKLFIEQRLAETRYLKYSMIQHSVETMAKATKNLMLLPMHDMNDGEKLSRALASFLDLEHHPKSTVIPHVNVAYSPKNGLLHQLMFSQGSVPKFLRKSVPKKLKSVQFKVWLQDINSTKDEPIDSSSDREAKEALEEILKVEIAFRGNCRDLVHRD